jgi:septal ring factor EnvC (AmiA/AmiB activator)
MKVFRSASPPARKVPKTIRHFSASLTCLICAPWLFACPALAKEKPTPPAVAEKRGDLKELRGQIDSLRKEMASAEGQRADAADQLKEIEQAISTTQRAIHQLAAQRGKLQATLKDLGAESQELERRLHSQRAQLEQLVYRQYLQGNPDALRLLLSGDEPNQTARDLHYLAAIGRARSTLLREIEANLQRKQALAAQTREQAGELAAIETLQKEQHGRLVAQREQRSVMLSRISAKIAQQRREIGNLQRDEKRLTQLIERLATQARHAEQARREAKVRPAPAAGKAAAPAAIVNENTPEAVRAGSFAPLKGELRLPTRGVVSNRFGGPRQEGSTWKGLFIRAQAGSEVKAIAAGRVVFADWMRGFGNLLIVDHGGSYLSVYGNNEAVVKQTGEEVRGGEFIATVGNSGGNPESGLYFELRYQGQALDPLKWVNLK